MIKDLRYGVVVSQAAEWLTETPCDFRKNRQAKICGQERWGLSASWTIFESGKTVSSNGVEDRSRYWLARKSRMRTAAKSPVCSSSMSNSYGPRLRQLINFNVGKQSRENKAQSSSDQDDWACSTVAFVISIIRTRLTINWPRYSITASATFIIKTEMTVSRKVQEMW